MCGAIRFLYEPALDSALEQFYTPEVCEQFRVSGLVETRFWQARPMLPIQHHGQIQLYDWGNRDKELRLPQTGWVRSESLSDGKWDYLAPREVVIPAIAGLEKKVWFRIDHGLRGILVRRNGTERIYMLTTPPTPHYRTLTGHERMPVLIDQDSIVPLG